MGTGLAMFGGEFEIGEMRETELDSELWRLNGACVRAET